MQAPAPPFMRYPPPAMRSNGTRADLFALFCLSSALFVLASGPFASTALGQERRYDLERFRPAPDRDGFLTITGTRTPGPLNYDIGLFTGYASEQLVLRDVIDGTRTGVVSDRVMGDLYFQLGLGGIVAVVIDAPFVLYQRGDGAAIDGGGALQSGALRDPRIAARIRLLGEDASVERDRHEGEGLALQGAITLPLGHEGAFAGEGAPQIEAEVLADFHLLEIGVGGVLGYRHRFAEPTVIGVPFRNQVYLGIGVQVPTFFLEDLVTLAEVDVTTDLENPFGNSASTVVEWRAGLRLQLRDLAISAMGGSGLVGGVGSPGFRGMLGVTFSPRVHDRDHDGIVDDQDECASLPEDFDENEDENGCPEPDNDHDLVPDLDDACPNEAAESDADDDGCTDPVLDTDGDGVTDDGDACAAEPEDRDGFEDADGCPDRDDDGDGVPVPADACPAAPEDRDTFEDEDGCPDLDDDRDGIPDAQDFCPREAEDADAFEPGDGCPEPDDDRDGVGDAEDTCPTEAETINGRRDEDGCPDPGRGAWRITGAPGSEAFGAEGRITFDAAGAIAAASAPSVAQLARLIRSDWPAPHVVEVRGASPEAIAALSAALTALGVAADVVAGSTGAPGRAVMRRGALDRSGTGGRTVTGVVPDDAIERARRMDMVAPPLPVPPMPSPVE